mgnify:CR=1 FL=1
MRGTPPVDTIMDLIVEDNVCKGVVAIDVLTDGIDNSGASLSSLAIPDGVSVTLIIARPNPKRVRPTVDDVLAWQVPGHHPFLRRLTAVADKGNNLFYDVTIVGLMPGVAI